MAEGRRILVVEDDAAIRSTVQLLLELEAYRVSVAANGQEALERIVEEGLPDLVLLDMRMPVMNGWRFAEALRERYGSEVPVVVMTAANDTAQRAADVGAEASLEKPFDLEELLATLKRLLPPARRAS